MQEVAQRLKSLRESVGLSQAKLAALMGATQASVNRYENGQSSPPLKILRWYADFFDVSLDYIFALPKLPLYAFLTLTVGRIAGVNYSFHICTTFRYSVGGLPASLVGVSLDVLLFKNLRLSRSGVASSF